MFANIPMNTKCDLDIPGGLSEAYSAGLKQHALCADFADVDIWGRMLSQGREIVISVQLTCL